MGANPKQYPINKGKDDEMKKLTRREQLFCAAYASCLNGREAAYKAGYTVCPEMHARKLLRNGLIREHIEKISEENKITLNEVKAGLRRIAFASSADAVRLILEENPSSLDVESLDLFNVSEIKRPKGGGLEIKFFDRIKALERLGELTESAREQTAGCVSFYQALENSAERQDDTDEI